MDDIEHRNKVEPLGGQPGAIDHFEGDPFCNSSGIGVGPRALDRPGMGVVAMYMGIGKRAGDSDYRSSTSATDIEGFATAIQALNNLGHCRQPFPYQAMTVHRR